MTKYTTILVVLIFVITVVNSSVLSKDGTIEYKALDASFSRKIPHTSCDAAVVTKGVNLYHNSMIVFTVNIPSDATYKSVLSFEIPRPELFSSAPVLFTRVNGIFGGNVNIGQSPRSLDLNLRTGLNTIAFTLQAEDPKAMCAGILFRSISIAGAIPIAVRGATLPYTEIEAEDANYVGTLVGPDRKYGTLASEASGRKAVLLSKSGDYVEFTIPSPSNGFVVRFSIPDSADGNGMTSSLTVFINGMLYQNVAITSRYSWTYGKYPFTKTPSDGNPHHFYDDVRFMSNTTFPQGTKFRLVTGSVPCHIDLVDFHLVPAPLPPPANSLNIVNYGADPSGQKDSSGGFYGAMSPGSQQNRPIYIPPGNYLLTGKIWMTDNVFLHGAGPWYTTIFGYEIGIFGRWGDPVKNTGLYDFSIIGQTRIRDDGSSDSGTGAAYSNSVFQNLWIEHTKVGMWLDGPFDHLTITGCIIRNTLADGINFHTGITNSVVQQTIVRNSADDGLAMWSATTPDANNVFKFNTIQVPILANGVAIYGGNDNSATDNLVIDTVTMGGGYHAGNRFGAVPIGGTTTFSRNSALRSGAHDDWFGNEGSSSNTFGGVYFWANDSPMSGNILVEDMELTDCTYEAIGFAGTSVTNVVINRVTIAGAGTWGVREDTAGSASFTNVTAQNLGQGGIWNCGQKFTITQGPGNSGWSDVHCVTPPPSL